MKIFQKNILGGGEILSTTKEKKIAEKQPKKIFPEINITSGINEKQAEGDAMLIHRFLQKRIVFEDLQKEELFLKIIGNEVDVKLGSKDAVSATRDSLLAFFTK